MGIKGAIKKKGIPILGLIFTIRDVSFGEQTLDEQLPWQEGEL